MRIDRAGVPFIAGALLPAAALLLARQPLLAAPLVALGGFFAYFFRDPARQSPAADGLIVSPADGRVLVAGRAAPGEAPQGCWQQVSIFLSPLDVHVNRVPIRGRVTRVEYKAGRFLPAYRPAAGASNERTEVWIDHDGHTVVFRQVVGVLARRIVCRLSEGQEVAAGERFGIMKFGSRVDVFVPEAATLLVAVGDTVVGGETVLASLPAAEGF
jgi:phosphatidylserine decarboxylase